MTNFGFTNWVKFTCQLAVLQIVFHILFVREPLRLICRHELEAIEHVFFSCGWTRPLWSSSNLSYEVNHVDSECILCFILDCGQKSP